MQKTNAPEKKFDIESPPHMYKNFFFNSGQGSKLAYVTRWVSLGTHLTRKYTTFSLEMDQKAVFLHFP